MAKKEEAKAPAAADADGKPAGKSKLKLIILIVVGLLLAIGLSVGATLFFLKGDKKEEAKSEEHAATEDAGKPVKKQAIYEVLAPAFVVLNSTHKCNAHPCMHFVRRLPAQALARA